MKNQAQIERNTKMAPASAQQKPTRSTKRIRVRVSGSVQALNILAVRWID